MSELSTETQALLNEAREARLPPDARLAAGHIELQEKIALESSRPWLLLSPPKLAIAAMILCLLAASSVAAYRIIKTFDFANETDETHEITSQRQQSLSSEARAPTPRRRHKQTPSVTTEDPPPAENESELPAPTEESESISRPTPRRTPPVTTSGVDRSPETLVEETRLLSKAQSALRNHEPHEALRYVEEHGSRFPQGTLSLERRAARLVAQCQLGSNSELRARAERFVERHPSSIYASRIRADCLR